MPESGLDCLDCALTILILPESSLDCHNFAREGKGGVPRARARQLLVRAGGAVDGHPPPGLTEYRLRNGSSRGQNPAVTVLIMS